MPVVYELLYGEGAGTYLPFARSRLRALEAINKDGFFSQTFAVDDAVINVRQEGKFQYIKISLEGAFYFEFATSGFPVIKDTLVQGGSLSVNTFKPLIVATNVAAKDGAIRIAPYVVKGARQVTGTSNSATGYLTQVQMINEPTKYPQTVKAQRKTNTYPNVMYETYAPTHAYTGLGYRGLGLKGFAFSFITQPGTTENFTARDFGYDYPWGYSVGKNKQTLALVTDEADWPHKSGRVTVTDDRFGTRTFGVMIDTSSKFHIFPLGAITNPLNDITQNILADHIRHIQPVFPEWVYYPPSMAKDYTLGVTKRLVDLPEHQWVFHPSGGKAVTVAYMREPFLHDETYWAANRNPDTPWNQTKFDDSLLPLLHDAAINQSSAAIPADGYNMAHYFHGSGIIEAVIDIELTGEELNQFNATVTVNTIQDPRFAEFMTMHAGYSYVDIPGKGVAWGDIIDVHMESYNYVHPPLTAPRLGIIVMKNITKGTDIFTTPLCPVLAIDLQTCSMVLQLQNIISNELRTTPMRVGTPQDIEWVSHHWAVWVIHSGSSKKLYFPESMTEEQKVILRDMATVDGRLYEDGLLTAGWTRIPLNVSGDGWNDADFNAVRDYFSYDKHYWYNEPWVLNDTDNSSNWTFYGTSYPTQGYVKYKVNIAYIPPSNLSDLTPKVYTLFPVNASNEHLFFCTNPKWGWHFYAMMTKQYSQVGHLDTFFTHPNGSYAYFNNTLIYNSVGVPNWSSGSPTSLSAQLADTLPSYSADAFEHCIFDPIHLEVRKSTGTAASLDTTFLAMYNQAVAAGKEAKTLEDGIEEMTYADQRGTFEINSALYNSVGDNFNSLDLKFTWNTQEWWFNEPAIRGQYVPAGEPSPAFPPNFCGGLLGVTLQIPWQTAPYSYTTGNIVAHPAFIDNDNPTVWPIRFCNALIVTA